MVEKIGRSGVQISQEGRKDAISGEFDQNSEVVSSKRIVNYGNHGWLWLEPCAVARGMHTIRVFLKTRVWYTSNESKVR
ncbi:unnamed protein product [Rotaria socialis]